MIASEFPTDDSPDEWEGHRRRHAAFRGGRLSIHVNCARITDQVRAAVEAGIRGESRLLLLDGPSGIGKTSQVCAAVAAIQREFPSVLLLDHYSELSPSARDPATIARRIAHGIRRWSGSGIEVAEGDAGVMDDALRWLAIASAHAASRDTCVVLAIDAMDRIAGPDALRWLPAHLPDRVIVLASAGPSLERDAVVRRGAHCIEVPGFDPANAASFIERFFAKHGKSVPSDVLDAVAGSEQCRLPAFVRILAEEMAIADSNGDVRKVARHCLTAHGVRDLLDRLIAAWESEFGSDPVERALEFLLVSGADSEERHVWEYAGLAPLTWARLRNRMSAAVSWEAGRVRLSHAHVLAAIRRRYLPDEGLERRLNRKVAEWWLCQQPALVDGAQLLARLEASGDAGRLRACIRDDHSGPCILRDAPLRALCAAWEHAMDTVPSAATSSAWASHKRWAGLYPGYAGAGLAMKIATLVGMIEPAGADHLAACEAAVAATDAAAESGGARESRESLRAHAALAGCRAARQDFEQASEAISRAIAIGRWLVGTRDDEISRQGLGHAYVAAIEVSRAKGDLVGWRKSAEILEGMASRWHERWGAAWARTLAVSGTIALARADLDCARPREAIMRLRPCLDHLRRFARPEFDEQHVRTELESMRVLVEAERLAGDIKSAIASARRCAELSFALESALTCASTRQIRSECAHLDAMLRSEDGEWDTLVEWMHGESRRIDHDREAIGAAMGGNIERAVRTMAALRLHGGAHKVVEPAQRILCGIGTSMPSQPISVRGHGLALEIALAGLATGGAGSLLRALRQVPCPSEQESDSCFRVIGSTVRDCVATLPSEDRADADALPLVLRFREWRANVRDQVRGDSARPEAPCPPIASILAVAGSVESGEELGVLSWSIRRRFRSRYGTPEYSRIMGGMHASAGRLLARTPTPWDLAPEAIELKMRLALDARGGDSIAYAESGVDLARRWFEALPCTASASALVRAVALACSRIDRVNNHDSEPAWMEWSNHSHCEGWDRHYLFDHLRLGAWGRKRRDGSSDVEVMGASKIDWRERELSRSHIETIRATLLVGQPAVDYLSAIRRHELFDSRGVGQYFDIVCDLACAGNDAEELRHAAARSLEVRLGLAILAALEAGRHIKTWEVARPIANRWLKLIEESGEASRSLQSLLDDRRANGDHASVFKDDGLLRAACSRYEPEAHWWFRQALEIGGPMDGPLGECFLEMREAVESVLSARVVGLMVASGIPADVSNDAWRRTVTEIRSMDQAARQAIMRRVRDQYCSR